jgi:hypothetical protein
MTLEDIVNGLKSAGQDYSQLFNNNPKYTAVAQNVTKGLENLVPPQFANTQDAKSQEYSKKLAEWALGNGMGMSGIMNDAINKDPYIMEMGGEDYANKLLSTIKSANKKDIKATQGQIYETSLQWPDAKREASDPLGEHHLLDWDKHL